MIQEFFSLSHLQRNRLYLIITIIFALIFAFQYLDLPYVNLLLSPSASLIYNNAKRFKPLQDDLNVITNLSSIANVPKQMNGSIPIKVLETTTISDMNKLLLQNYASYRSMVYKLM